MNIVREYINEKFIEESDPIWDLNVGLPTLIKKWFAKFKVDEITFNKHIKINSDYTLILNDDVKFGRVKMNGNFPDYINFKESKSFDCSETKMTTLRGCPEIVKGYFDCSGNRLKSLDYCPKEVSGDFLCQDNKTIFTEETVREKCNVGGKVTT